MESQNLKPNPEILSVQPPSPGQEKVAASGQYLQTLVSLGLEPGQALIYETLLKSGPMKAGKIALKSGLKRGLTYKLLEELVNLGLVTKHEPTGKVAVFEPMHPLKLAEYAQEREQKIKTAQSALDGIMGLLTSNYNLALHKPGVQFYEGKDGIKKVLDDSLTSSTEIYAYSDIEAIIKHIPEINEEYVKQRERKKIKKRGIFIDTPFARKTLAGYHTAITQNKFMKHEAKPFEVILQIYDGKISYINLHPGKMMGTIIADPFIYNMHRYLYEFLWQRI